MTGDHRRILVVEDDPETAGQLVEELTTSGYEVDLAVTGREALSHGVARDYAVITIDRMLPDIDGITVMRQMRDDGIRNALAFVTSAYSSYSGCRQYREDVERAREAVGEGAPQVSKLRAFFNHPGFVGPNIADEIVTSIGVIDVGGGDRRRHPRRRLPGHSDGCGLRHGEHAGLCGGRL